MLPAPTRTYHATSQAGEAPQRQHARFTKERERGNANGAQHTERRSTTTNCSKSVSEMWREATVVRVLYSRLYSSGANEPSSASVLSSWSESSVGSLAPASLDDATRRRDADEVDDDDGCSEPER